MVKVKEGRGSNVSLCSSPLAHHASTMVHLNKTKAAGNVHHFPIGPQMTGDVHPLVQRMAIGKVDKVEKVNNVVRLPDHLVTTLEVGSRSTHRQGEFGAVKG